LGVLADELGEALDCWRDAAYEKRTCWPSPGTRVPKWMSARSATPASLSRRFLKSSESRAPTLRQASVTLGQT
jgi:hypothetical protein